MKTGIELIAAERERQVSVEGWSPDHDDKHTDGSLAKAAACYCDPYFPKPLDIVPFRWPWAVNWWKPASRAWAGSRADMINALIRQYAKAGALIAAEIDRLLRSIGEWKSEKSQNGLAFVVPVNNALFALGAEINAINHANGWDVLKPEEWPDVNDDDETQKRKTRKLGTVIALIHSEASEALEALRHRDRQNFEEELADVMIRILDCSHGLDIDIGKVVQEKLAKNRTRGFRHGGKAV